MRGVAAFALCVLLFPAVSLAQAATPADKIGLDIQATDAATATAYTWRAYVDGSAAATVLTGGVCSGTTAISCQFPIPASFPVGSHTMTVTAGNVAGESKKSSAFTFVLTREPNAPFNIRIIVTPIP
jgi:hypothetical protein